MMEFAPAYGGLVFAISNTVSNISGFLAPISQYHHIFTLISIRKHFARILISCFLNFSNWQIDQWRQYNIKVATCILDFSDCKPTRIDSISNFWNRWNTIMGTMILYFIHNSFTISEKMSNEASKSFSICRPALTRALNFYS